MTPVKAPEVAGIFYPARPGKLREAVRDHLDSADRRSADGAPTEARAIIVPHAGYIYSGPVAASAYARIRGGRRGRRGGILRAVVLGPSHHLYFKGLAVSGAEAFATPLGGVPVDPAGVEAALSLPQVRLLDEAFEGEHCIEVHLPFLVETLGEFSLVPLLVGEATPAEAAEAIEALWDGRTLIVVSSDLSHHLTGDEARKRDGATSRAIEEFRLDAIGPGEACGHVAVKGLLEAARRRGLRARAVDLRNSGDTAGPADQVVGYGAFIVSL